MRKNNRIPLSPCLRRFRFYFDLLGKTAKDYLFFTDLQEKLANYESCLPKLTKLDLPNKTTNHLCDLLLQGTIFSPHGLSMKDLQKYLDKSENTIYAHLKKIPAELLLVDNRTKNYLYKLRYTHSQE